MMRVSCRRSSSEKAAAAASMLAPQNGQSSFPARRRDRLRHQVELTDGEGTVGRNNVGYFGPYEHLCRKEGHEAQATPSTTSKVFPASRRPPARAETGTGLAGG